MSGGTRPDELKPRPARRARADDARLAQTIGERLKELRARAGLSLERLSRQAGVSRAMLGQIERGRSIPTITVLMRIAAAFQLPVSAFLAPPTAALPRAQVLRRETSQRLASPDGRFISRALFPFGAPRRAELYELTLGPDCSRESTAHAPGTTENLVVASGTVDLEVDGLIHELRAGDSIHFIADVPHRYGNHTAETAVAYLVMVYAQPVSY